MMWGYYPGMGWWMVVSTLLWLLVIGAAVWALLRWVAQQTQPGAHHQAGGTAGGPSALEILRRRFANGEIDADTFERMRRQLEAAGSKEETPTPVG